MINIEQYVWSIVDLSNILLCQINIEQHRHHWVKAAIDLKKHSFSPYMPGFLKPRLATMAKDLPLLNEFSVA